MKLTINRILYEEHEVSLPVHCPNPACARAVEGFDQLNLVFERLHMDSHGDAYDVSVGQPEFTIGAQCRHCGVDLVESYVTNADDNGAG